MLESFRFGKLPGASVVHTRPGRYRTYADQLQLRWTISVVFDVSFLNTGLTTRGLTPTSDERHMRRIASPPPGSRAVRSQPCRLHSARCSNLLRTSPVRIVANCAHHRLVLLGVAPLALRRHFSNYAEAVLVAPWTRARSLVHKGKTWRIRSNSDLPQAASPRHLSSSSALRPEWFFAARFSRWPSVSHQRHIIVSSKRQQKESCGRLRPSGALHCDLALLGCGKRNSGKVFAALSSVELRSAAWATPLSQCSFVTRMQWQSSKFTRSLTVLTYTVHSHLVYSCSCE